MDFAVPANHRRKIKEKEKRDKYLHLAREQKKTMEHEGDGDTNSIQSLGKGSGRVRNRTMILTTPLLRLDRTPRKVLMTWGDLLSPRQPEYWEESWRLEGTCCHSNSSERPSANAGEKNSQGVIIITIIIRQDTTKT